MSKQEKDYTLFNKVMRDPKLSLKAKGLFSYLFNQSAEWRGQIYNIKQHATDRRTGIQTAAQELKDLGYLATKVERVDGVFVGKYYQIITKK